VEGKQIRTWLVKVCSFKLVLALWGLIHRKAILQNMLLGRVFYGVALHVFAAIFWRNRIFLGEKLFHFRHFARAFLGHKIVPHVVVIDFACLALSRPATLAQNRLWSAR